MARQDHTRRHMLRVGGGGLVVGALAACSPLGSGESGGSLAAREVTLTHWFTGNGGNIRKSLLEEQAEVLRTKLGIRLTLESGGTGSTVTQKVIVAATSGLPPSSAEIAYWDGATLFAPGMSVDPDEELKRDREWVAQRKDYFPGILDSQLWKGKLTGIPLDTNCMTMFYDKAILNRAGVAPPTPNWTRDEFTEKAIRTAAAPDRWGFSFMPESLDFLVFFGAAGGKLMNADHTKWQVDNDIGRETLKYLYDLSYARKVSPAPPMGELMRTGQGKVAFDMTINPRLPVLRQAGLDVATAPIPSHRARYTMSHGFVVAVLKVSDGEAQQRAARLGMWLSAPNVQAATILKFDAMPVSKGAREHPDFQARLVQDPAIKVFADQMQYTYRIPTFPTGRKAEREEFDAYLKKAYNNEIGINEALAQGQRAAQLILDQDLKVGAK